MSQTGKKSKQTDSRNNKNEAGYILSDVLMAVAILAMGFITILSALGLAGKFTARQSNRIQTLLEIRNQDEANTSF